MATVQDSQKCSVCGGMMVCLFNSRTTEEDCFCLRCGTTEEFFLLKDEDGNYVKKDGKFVIDYKKTQGYGAYAITSKDGHGKTGCFHKPITEEDIEEFKEILADDDIDENQSFLTKWENGQITVLAGNPNEEHLLSYDELVKKWEKESKEYVNKGEG